MLSACSGRAEFCHRSLERLPPLTSRFSTADMESFFLQLRVSTAVAVSVSRGGVRAADAEIKNPSGEIPEL